MEHVFARAELHVVVRDRFAVGVPGGGPSELLERYRSGAVGRCRRLGRRERRSGGRAFLPAVRNANVAWRLRIVAINHVVGPDRQRGQPGARHLHVELQIDALDAGAGRRALCAKLVLHVAVVQRRAEFRRHDLVHREIALDIPGPLGRPDLRPVAVVDRQVDLAHIVFRLAMELPADHAADDRVGARHLVGDETGCPGAIAVNQRLPAVLGGRLDVALGDDAGSEIRVAQVGAVDQLPVGQAIRLLVAVARIVAAAELADVVPPPDELLAGPERHGHRAEPALDGHDRRRVVLEVLACVRSHLHVLGGETAVVGAGSQRGILVQRLVGSHRGVVPFEIEGTSLRVVEMPTAVVPGLGHAVVFVLVQRAHPHRPGRKPRGAQEHHAIGRRKLAAATVVAIGGLDRVAPFLVGIARGLRFLFGVEGPHAAVVLVTLDFDAGSKTPDRHGLFGVGHAGPENARQDALGRKPVAPAVDDDSRIHHVAGPDVLDNQVLVRLELALQTFAAIVRVRVIGRVELVKGAPHAYLVLVRGVVHMLNVLPGRFG